ncbi:hypothetical protein ACFE04_031994 [Oxalis oulophora]
MDLRGYMSSTGSKVKEKWEFKYNVGEELISHDHQFQRPTSNYTCSFCKRQFRSAQALGGHMNVHRRDRARLRLLPPWFFDRKPNPNPNPNPNPSSSSSKFLPCPFINNDINSPRRVLRDEKKTLVDYLIPSDHPGLGSSDGVGKMKSCMEKNEFVSKGKTINLNLEMGIEDHPREVLDLDLRLGF